MQFVPLSDDEKEPSFTFVPLEAAPVSNEPPPYKNRIEALDDAVNLLEEGVPTDKVRGAFEKGGIKWGDIVTHGQKRGSEFFKQQPAGPVAAPRDPNTYQPSGEIKAFEPSALDEIVNTAKRGALRVQQEKDTLKFQTGIIDSATYAERTRENERRMGAAAPSGNVVAGLDRLQKANEKGSYTDVALELLNPSNFKATAALIAESAIPSLANIPYTIAGGVAGGPVGAGTVTAATSFASEYANALGDTLEKRGVDKSDALAIRAAIEDPEVMAQAREYGVKRGIPVAIFDGISAGFAGRFIRTLERAAEATGKAATKTAVAGATAKEAGLQIGSGMAGEFGAQKMTGENKPLDVLIEGLAELPGGVVEAGTNIYGARKNSPSSLILDAANKDMAERDWSKSADQVARNLLDPTFYDPAIVDPIQTSRITSFTPPGSPTQEAGLVDIVVPVPDAPVAVNPDTEREFGLDKLRMGAGNVGTTGTPGGLAGGGGDVAGSLNIGGVADAGLQNADTRWIGGGSAGVNAPAGGTTVPAGSGAGEPLANLTGKYNNGDNRQLVEPWFGRRGGGYTTEGDAQQALPGRQRMFPDLDWKIEAMPNGRFMLAGYSQETNLGTQTTQAQQGQTQGQAPVAGSAGAGVGVPLATGGVTPTAAGVTPGVGELALQPGSGSAAVGSLTTPQGAQAAGLNQPLRLAAPVPLRRAGEAVARLSQESGLNAELSKEPLTLKQQAGSAIARLLGLNFAVVKGDAGTLPNGFVIPDISKKDVYVAADADDAPLAIVVHEGYHLLPEDLKGKVKSAIGTIFKEEKRDQFSAQFGYDKNNKDLVDEEIGAFLSQAVSRRQDFLEKLQQQLGNKDFIAVIGTILTKLKEVVSGAKTEYGEAFLQEYVKDIPAAVELLSGVYAEAMNRQQQGQSQSQQPMPLAASNRSRLDLDFKDVIKRTPELQAAAEKVKSGEMTAQEYDSLVNKFKPVEAYKSVPNPATADEAMAALRKTNAEKEGTPTKDTYYGRASQTLKAGDPVGLRLDIPSYSKTGTWVVTVHEPRKNLVAGGAGTRIGYESVAAATNVQFSINEKGAIGIAAGKEKNTIATMEGKWKPTTPAEAKLKADQALKSKDWVQVGMDPERHSYFYDRATMQPVTAADEVIQIGPLVLAKNPTYGDKSSFMFSNRTRSVADYNPKVDNYNNANDMEAMLRESVPADVVAKADEFVAQYYKDRAPAQVSPQDRLKAEILLKPKMQAAEKIKPEFDQKVLDIVDRTGAIGQMLAPIKGMKRAAEKLAVEENFEVDNIKDLVRATIVVNGYQDAKQIVDEIGKEFKILRIKNRSGTPLSGESVKNEDRQKFGGYADVLINVQMPNGTVGEIQINTPAMLSVKDNQGHKLYEAARDLPAGSAQRAKIEDAMRVLYDAAFFANSRQSAAQAKKAASEMGAPAAGSAATGTSSAPESASLKTAPSGNATNSSPENEATNLQSAGKAAGSFIEGSPDEPSISQSLYRSNRAGKYSYETDQRGRLIVSGDTDRIRFLAKQAATGTLTKDKDAVVFKAADAEAVINALKNEPTPNKRVASTIAKRLGLSDAELKSTSLEFQTGEPGDRAFSGPLQGGIPETVKFLEDRRRQSGLRLLDIGNPEDQDLLAKLIAAEALGAIRSSGNALEWYDETIARTLAMAAIKYPELGDDVNAQKAFRLAIAIASQGLNVENNLAFAMRQYDAFRKDGVYPEVGEGESAEAMAGNFRLANALRKEMGPDLFRRFLETEFTIGELNQAGFEPGGELIDEKVLGSSVFGPKIGFGFYSNLNGNFEPVTMDMWFMRTIGRLTGSLRSFDAEKFGAQLDKFRAAFGATGDDGIYSGQFDAGLVERARTDQDSAIELARQVKKAHEQDFRKNRAAFDAGDRKKTKLVYAAETMIQSIDKPKDVPASGGERRLLREVVRKAVSTLEQAYGQRIPPAAMQALIWYPEQELYKALGVKLSVTSQDYAGAIEKILTEEGYDGTELRTAAESGSRRVRQANGNDAGREVEGDGQGAGGSSSIQGQERDAFIRSRYERTQLEKERLEPKRRGVIFEVAPDPNNERLTNAWRNLTQAQRLEISERVARDIVPKVLAQFKTDGIVAAQVGSYLDDTNPSFTVLLNKGDPVEIAKALGFVLAQDSMMVVSPKAFKGGDSVGAIAIQLGDKTPEEVDAIYQTLRGIEVNGQKPIGGQSMANGVMTVLNYSDVPTKELAILVDQKLNKGYTVLTRDVFAAFPEKKEYDYASQANDGRGSQADLRRGARALRDEATAAVERELGAAGIQFSNRVTETPEFKRWFGESQVVDEDGQPLVVYHGSTAKGVTVFDTTRVTTRSARGDVAGTYFTADQRAASGYTREPGATIRSPRGEVVAAYLRIENPLNTTDAIKKYRKQGMSFGDAKRKALEALTPENDGIIFDGDGVNPSEYVVFKPEQIKSATGNNGEFDANNPSILRSNRVKLADDLAEQEKFLQAKAEEAGYKSIDEFVDKDYEGFAAAAKEWRDAYPVDAMYSNRTREGWIVGRDELGRPTFGAGAKAYRLVADLANSVLGMISLKPIDTNLSRAMRQMKVEIAKAREMTVDAAEHLGKLTQQEREMISDVIEGELKRGAKPPKRVLELAASMQGIMSEQTAELVRLGMLSEDAAGRWDGKYLPRFYESKLKDEGKAWLKAAKSLLGRQKVMQGIGGSSLKGRGLFQTIPVEELEAWLAEGWEERDPNFDPDTDTEITVWRDYTRQERDDMGEIRDSMFRFVMGYNKSQRDIALGRLYENLADTVASKKEQPGFVQVPASNVEDTRARRYGKLAGKWVPQEVLDHLVAFDQSQQNELLNMYLKGMSMWKEGKTVLNPVSHANNVMSNVTMAHFAGVSYWDVNKYIGATRDLIKRDPMVIEAEDNGLWTGTMTQAELVQLLPDQLKVLAAKTESKAGKAVEGVWNAMSFWLRKPLGKAYEAEDLFFRYLIYRDARERGLEPADAVDFAQKYIFTYDDLPKNARRIRDFALPFFAYTYKVVPTLAETALKYPWRYAAPAVALYTINAAMYGFAAGADDDWWEIIKRYVTDSDFRKKAKDLEADERKNLPDWMKGASLSLGTQKSIRLGVDEATGLPVFLDVSRIFPGGDLFDAHNNAGGIPLLAPITPNTPILTIAAAMLFNKDTFRGKDLVKPSDTDAEAARKRASWMWQQVTPAIAVGNTHFERAMNVIANQVGQPLNLGFAEYTGIDRQGQPVQGSYAAMQTVGIKARPIDLELSAQIQKAETQKLIREIGAEISSINKLESRGAISADAAERQRDVQREKRQRLKQGLTVDGDEKE